MRCANCHTEDSFALKQREIKGGATQIVYQCEVCGRADGGPVSQSRVPDWRSLPRWDNSIQKRYSRKRAEAVAAASAHERERFFAWYNEYLKSPGWRERRQKVIARCGGLCEGCRDAEATQVHHLTYSHVGREMLYHLVALCDECHEQAHIPNDEMDGDA